MGMNANSKSFTAPGVRESEPLTRSGLGRLGAVETEMAISMQPKEPPSLKALTAHPLANLFPLMEGAAFDEFAADIRQHGLREPIVLLGGQILDGRNRFRACEQVSVQPRFEEYRGDDPAAFVVSLNLKRRHLTESQRGMVAASLATMKHGGNRKSDQAANLPVETTQADAAKMLNVSERTLRTAKTVQDEGAPALVKAVETGEVTIAAAATIAKTRLEEQAIIIALDLQKRKAIVRKIREEAKAESYRTAGEKLEQTEGADALSHFLKTEKRLPSRTEAQKIARVTGAHTLSSAGYYESPLPPDELAAAQRKRNAVGTFLEAMSDLLGIDASPQETALFATEYDEEDISEKLPKAIEWLAGFQEAWSVRHA